MTPPHRVTLCAHGVRGNAAEKRCVDGCGRPRWERAIYGSVIVFFVDFFFFFTEWIVLHKQDKRNNTIKSILNRYNTVRFVAVSKGGEQKKKKKSPVSTSTLYRVHLEYEGIFQGQSFHLSYLFRGRQAAKPFLLLLPAF